MVPPSISSISGEVHFGFCFLGLYRQENSLKEHGCIISGTSMLATQQSELSNDCASFSRVWGWPIS